jgi:hypothetical protein
MLKLRPLAHWLFNRQEYLRLLPPDQMNFAHVAKVELGCGNERSSFLQGTGLWGQFLRHGNRLNEELAAVFVGRVKDLRDTDDITPCFPLPMLLVSGPVQRWYKLYGIHYSRTVTAPSQRHTSDK